MKVKRVMPRVLREIGNDFRRRIREVFYGVDAKTDLVPITDVSDDDVFIVGYPKSGNTWLQNLISGIVFGVDVRYAPDTLIQELVPDVHYKEYYHRFLTPSFFKSHHLPRPDFRNVIYVLRDGRDVMVSYRHFLEAVNERPFSLEEMVRPAAQLWPSSWSEHVNRWLNNPFQARMMVVKYEDLLRDCEREVRRFCDFLDIERDEESIRRTVEQSSFASLKQREARSGVANKVWSGDKAFFRKGREGSYREEMSAEALAYFLESAGETLRKTGYLD